MYIINHNTYFVLRCIRVCTYLFVYMCVKVNMFLCTHLISLCLRVNMKLIKLYIKTMHINFMINWYCWYWLLWLSVIVECTLICIIHIKTTFSLSSRMILQYWRIYLNLPITFVVYIRIYIVIYSTICCIRFIMSLNYNTK